MKNLLCVRLLYCPTLTVGLSLVLLLYAVVIMISDAAHRLAVNAAHKPSTSTVLLVQFYHLYDSNYLIDFDGNLPIFAAVIFSWHH